MNSTKAQIISDDGDAFSVGDYVVCTTNSGQPALGVIQSLYGQGSDSRANVGIVDAYLEPTGETTVCSLMWLSEVNVMVAPEDTEEDASKATPGVNSPDDDWAYVPKDGPKSKRKLYIGDEQYVKLAVEAFCKGLMGNKTKGIPSDQRDTVKSRISGAIDSKISDKGEKAYYHEWLKTGKKPDREPSEAAKSVRTLSSIVDVPDVAVKFASEDRNEINGYLVLFGDKDHPDLQGDWFTKNTNFHLDWYKQIPVLWEHGQDGALKTATVGVAQIGMDDVGVWIKAQFEKSNRYIEKYVKPIKDFIAEKRMGWSSGSMSHLVAPRANPRTGSRGEITDWPLCEATLTLCPAESRTLGISLKHFIEPRTAELAYKSMGLPLDHLDLPQDAEQERAQESARFGHTATKSNPASSTNSTGKRKPTMDEIQLAVEAALKKREEEAQAKAAQEAAIKTEIEQKATEIATKAIEDYKKANPVPAGKSLPGNQGIVPQPDGSKPKGSVIVVDNVKYADLNAEDLAFMVAVYGAYAAKGMQRVSGNPYGGASNLTDAEETAIKFFQEMRSDPDRKFEREISAKALRARDRHELPDSVTAFLPYKSMDAVFGNDYDDAPVKAAIKSNELDNTGQTGFGLEWVPTLWSANIWRRVRITNPVLANLQVIDMPSNPFNLTVESTDPTAFFIGEATDLAQLAFTSGGTLTTSKIASNKQALTAFKQGVRIGFSNELVEDSIIPILPMYRYQAERVIYNTIDDTFLNGDTTTSASTNINLIDGTPTAGTSYLAFDGFRKYGLVTNTAQQVDFGGGSPTLNLFRKMRALMGRSYMVDIPNLVYIVAPEVYMKMLSMPEFSAFQNSGVLPTAVTGLLPYGSVNQVGQGVQDPVMPVGFIDAIPVYVSAQLTSNTNSAGKIIGTPTTTFGTAILYHKTRWAAGFKRRVQLDVLSPGAMPLSDTYQIWATVRFGLKSFDTTSAVVGFDISTTF